MAGVMINGSDLADLGIGMTDITGWSDSPRVSRAAYQTGGSFGQVSATIETVDARTITIEGLIKGNTITTRNAVLEAALAHMRGNCEITPADQPDKVIIGELVRHETRGVTGILTMLRDVIRVRFDFRCDDPNYRSLNATIAAFDTTARPVPMGTSAHHGTLTIAGAPTDPVITVKDYRGASVASLEFTGTLAADEAWIVDLYEHTVTLSDSGVETDAASVLTGGNWFHFRPEWGDHVSESWPTIETDGGSGYLTYYRRWKT